MAATVVALCVGFAPSEAEANVRPLDLASLVAASGTIVVGRVDSVDDGIATLVVERTIRGDSTWQVIRFRATRSWTCDDTHAEVGERLLAFFLEEDPTIPLGRNFPVFENTGWGQGLMRIRRVRGVEYISTIFSRAFPLELPRQRRMDLMNEFHGEDGPAWEMVREFASSQKRDFALIRLRHVERAVRNLVLEAESASSAMADPR